MATNRITVRLIPADLRRYLAKLDDAGNAYHFVANKKPNGVQELELMVDGGYPGITVTLATNGTWALEGMLPLPAP